MGLGLSVGDMSCGQWSYSGFNAFRKKLARQIGIDLDQMEGFGEMPPTSLDRIPKLSDVLAGKAELPTKEEIKQWGEEVAWRYEASRGQIPWDTVDDPIVPLLHVHPLQLRGGFRTFREPLEN
jgi:hypothetical protein